MGRSPHGERGLKFLQKILVLFRCRSLPARGAWIEIGADRVELHAVLSLPARGAWIEMARPRRCRCGTRSLPARGAWIEI